MKNRIEKLLARFSEVEELLGRGDAMSDKKRYKELVQEHSRLSAIRDAWNEFEKAETSLKEARDIVAKESDPDLLSMAKEEIESLDDRIEPLKKRVEALLVPPDPRDNRNIIIELRAGTGGDEAALFVGDCVRMYQLYAAHKGWSVEQLSASESDVGGYKEFVMGLSGQNVFRLMQYEAGTHRVQRVPKTETQGRVHTSAITVAVLLEPSEDEPVDLDEKDLRIDTYRSSGAGGQHVNTTDSAVRITHIPTGVVTYCQDERSQHKNKAKAMRMLVAKIAEEKRRKEAKERADLRSSQVGSGDRSERIRTYNFSQNRLTDHRINLTLYKLDQVMQGDLDEITQALVSHYYQEMLTSHE